MLDLGTLRIGIKADGKAAKKELEDVKKETKSTEKQTQESTEKMGSSFEKFGSAVKVAGAAAIAGITAIGVGVSKVSKEALDSYSSFEQLTGGVETLFKDSGSTVEEYAQQAYQTAGMSANEYMDTITSFSASLISSLGGDTAKAAEAGNQAVIDMSDNANKMGTNIQDIQNAYQGFAKQNYTMLDNLKLGYGGTKEEMERLLADAEKLTGQHYDLSSFNDITEAIHAIQTEMGITGTTAKEAATTIEGSVNSAKAAYSNWLTSLGDENADLDESTQKLIDSILTAASNIIPRLAKIVSSIGNFLKNNLSDIIDQIGVVIQANAPNILAAIGTLAEGIWSVLVQLGSQIIEGISSAIPQILEAVIQDVFKSFTNLDKGITPLITTFALLGVGVSKVIGVIKVLQSNVTNLVTGFKNIPATVKKGTTAIKNFATVSNLAKGAIAALATAAIALVVTEAIKYFDHVNKMKTATEGLVSTAKNAPAQLDATAKSIKNVKSGADQTAPSLDGLKRSAEDALQAQVDLANDLSEKWGTLQSSADTVSYYVGVIEQLADKSNLTATEQLQLKTAVEQVNSICGTSIEVIDAQNGKLSESIDQIKQQTAAWIDNAKAQAAQESLVAIEKELINANIDLQNATDRYNASYKNLSNSTDPSEWQALNYQVEQNKRAMEEAQTKVDSLKNSEQTYIDVINGTASAIANIIPQNTAFTEVLDRIGMSVQTAASNLQTFGLTATDVQALSAEQFAWLAQNASASTDQIAAQFSSLNWTVPDSMRAMFESAGYAIDESGHLIIDSANSVGDGAVTSLDKTTDASGQGTALAEGYANAIADKAAYAEEKGTDVANGAGNGLQSNYYDASTWGYDLGKNFGDGLASSKSYVSSKADELAQATQDKLGHSIPKKGLLHNHGKGEIPWGEHLVQNIAKGMSNAQSELVSVANKTAEVIAKPLSNINTDIGINSKGIDSISNFNAYKSQRDRTVASPNQTINNYYIGDTKLTTYNEQQFAQDFIRLMKKYERLATT